MDLSEEKAKEVLDFLAKKFGYDKFVLNGKEIGVIKENDPPFVQLVALPATKEPNYAWITLNDWLDFEQSYAKCLKIMLIVVEKGYSITAYYHKNNFIAPFTTLEELLVAYDLETGYTTT